MNFLFQSDAGGVAVAALEAALCERDADILRLKEELKVSKQEDTVAQVSRYRKSRQQKEREAGRGASGYLRRRD